MVSFYIFYFNFPSEFACVSIQGECDAPFWTKDDYNVEECGYDGGDCGNATDFESTIEPTPTEEPTDEGTTEATGSATEEESEPWTDEMRAKYPDCNVLEVSRLGNGKCDPGSYNTMECKYDGGDCATFNELFPDCVPDESTAQWKAQVDSGDNLHLFWPTNLKDLECDTYRKFCDVQSKMSCYKYTVFG